MSIRNRVKRPATIHVWGEGGRDDASGDYTDEFDPAAEVAALGEVRQQKTSENRDGGLVVVTQWLLFLVPVEPDGTLEVEAQDEVTVKGMGRWAFEGDPAPITNPRTGRLLHWQGIVRKVE